MSADEPKLPPQAYTQLAEGEEPIVSASESLIADMGSFTVWSRYLRYVGAGAACSR